MSTENSRATRLSWLKSLISARPAPGYWIFTATSRPSRQRARCTCPIEAAAAGLSLNSANVRASGAEVFGEDTVHRAGGQRRGRLLQLGQRCPVEAGELRREGGLEDRQGLPELHRAALELAEHAEDLVGRAVLDLGGNELAGRPPSRLPRPSAVRPASPTGRVASFAVRVIARRGRTTDSFVGHKISPATATAIMLSPGPPPPLPIRQDEFQRAVGHSAGRCGPVDEGQGLRGGLAGHRCRQHRVAGGRIRAAAGELSQDERPGGIALGPGQVEASQARRPPGSTSGPISHRFAGRCPVRTPPRRRISGSSRR